MDSVDNNLKKMYEIMSDYGLNKEEQEEMLSLVIDIFKHHEFQKRMSNQFLHHSDITLGYHILQDTTVTYILCKKKQKKGVKVNIKLALYISMMHDLYTVPWQNNKNSKSKKFKNKHGFRHPVESVINSLTWYEDIFDGCVDKYDLIDGIVHHMYPLPVSSFQDSNINILELKNFDLVNNIKEDYLEVLTKTSNRAKIWCYSFALPTSIEGRIVAKADKIVSIDNLKNLSSVIALLTGKNKSLIRRSR